MISYSEWQEIYEYISALSFIVRQQFGRRHHIRNLLTVVRFLLMSLPSVLQSLLNRYLYTQKNTVIDCACC